MYIKNTYHRREENDKRKRYCFTLPIYLAVDPVTRKFSDILRLEESGVITGYKAEIDTDALGRALHVMISFKFNSGQKYDKKPNDILIPILRSSSDVIHFWEIYGELDFLIEAAFSSKERMHRFLDNLRSYGFVRSHLIAMSMKGAVQEA